MNPEPTTTLNYLGADLDQLATDGSHLGLLQNGSFQISLQGGQQDVGGG
jgi:hypothetical protein